MRQAQRYLQKGTQIYYLYFKLALLQTPTKKMLQYS